MLTLGSATSALYEPPAYVRIYQRTSTYVTGQDHPAHGYTSTPRMTIPGAYVPHAVARRTMKGPRKAPPVPLELAAEPIARELEPAARARVVAWRRELLSASRERRPRRRRLRAWERAAA